MAAIVSTLTAVALAAASVTWSTANSVATGDQDEPGIATNRTGRVAVVWADDPASNGHTDIYLRSYSNGTPVYEKKLSAGGTSGTNWKHTTPDVGLDDQGNAVVVWAEDADGNAYNNISYRVVSPAGTVLASGQANANAAGDQIVPRVAVDPDGTPNNASAVAFTVVWQDIQPTAVTIRAAGYTTGTSKAYEVQASQASGTHHRPDVAVSAAGDATIVWEEDADGNGYTNIGLTRLAKANGAVLLTPRTANAEGAGQQLRPAIAANFTGDLIVAWESDHTGANGVWSRAFTATDTARYAEIETSSGAGAHAPAVGLDDQANALVGWTVAGVDGWLRGFNPDGSTAGRLAAQTLTQTTTGRQDEFTLAVSPWSEVVVCYTDDNDGNGADQVMLGLGAVNNDDVGAMAGDVRAMWPARTAPGVPDVVAARSATGSVAGFGTDSIADLAAGFVTDAVAGLVAGFVEEEIGAAFADHHAGCG